jgi:hypothetical protein
MDQTILSEGGGPSITDWIQAISSGVTALAAIGVLVQILIAWKQIKSSEKWSKINATFSYFSSDRFIERERKAAESLRHIGTNLYNPDGPLKTEQVDLIFKRTDVYAEIKDYLNLLESFSTAINTDALDEDCAYSSGASTVLRDFYVFQPLIKLWREKRDDSELYIDLEKLALRWKKKFEDERAKRKAQEERAARQIRKPIPPRLK